MENVEYGFCFTARNSFSERRPYSSWLVSDLRFGSVFEFEYGYGFAYGLRYGFAYGFEYGSCGRASQQTAPGGGGTRPDVWAMFIGGGNAAKSSKPVALAAREGAPKRP